MWGTGHSRNLMGSGGWGGEGLGSRLRQGFWARGPRGLAGELEPVGVRLQGWLLEGLLAMARGQLRFSVSPLASFQAPAERRAPHAHLRQTDLGPLLSLLRPDAGVPWSGRAGEAMLTFGPFLPP